MLRVWRATIPSPIADCYAASLCAALAYGKSENYLVAALVGLVALSVFRIQQLVRRHRRQRR